MIGGVPGGGNGDQPLAAIKFDHLAIVQHLVGCILLVEARVGARPDAFQRQRRAANNGRTGGFPQRAAGRRMIAVRMGAGNRGKRTAIQCIEDGLNVLVHVRAWIDHHQLIVANQIGLSSEICEWRRVACQQARNTSLQRLQFGVWLVHSWASATNEAIGLARQAAAANAG